MALVKARPPVTAIDKMESGTTLIEILNSGGDIDLDVGGVDVADIEQTLFTIDDLVTLVARKLLSEDIDIQTTAGAQAAVRTSATELEVGTTSVHPVDFIMNAIAAMTINTSGKVELTTVGDTGNELVDKDYVDNAISTAGANIVFDNATTGQISIPNDTANNFVIKWGKVTGLTVGAGTVVTYGTPYPNATLGVFLQNLNSGMGEETNNTVVVETPSAASFEIYHPPGAGSLNARCFWLAIGY